MYNIIFRVGRSKWRPLVLICLPLLHRCLGEGYSHSFLEIPWVPCALEYRISTSCPSWLRWRGHTPLLQSMSSRAFPLTAPQFCTFTPSTPLLQIQTEQHLVCGFCCLSSFCLISPSPFSSPVHPITHVPVPEQKPPRGCAGGKPGASLAWSSCPFGIPEQALDPFAQRLVEVGTDNMGWRLLVLAVTVSLMCVVFPYSPFRCRWHVGAAPVKWPMQLLWREDFFSLRSSAKRLQPLFLFLPPAVGLERGAAPVPQPRCALLPPKSPSRETVGGPQHLHSAAACTHRTLWWTHSHHLAKVCHFVLPFHFVFP